jgi:DnaJ-class molecular chaperone
MDDKGSKSEGIDEKCPACFGTGYEPQMQPAHPGEQGVPIKPLPKCQKCGGTGRKRKPTA